MRLQGLRLQRLRLQLGVLQKLLLGLRTVRRELRVRLLLLLGRSTRGRPWLCVRGGSDGRALCILSRVSAHGGGRTHAAHGTSHARGRS